MEEICSAPQRSKCGVNCVQQRNVFSYAFVISGNLCILGLGTCFGADCNEYIGISVSQFLPIFAGRIMLSDNRGLDRAQLLHDHRGTLPAEFLPPDIYDSWMRCISLGLDTRRPPETQIVSQATLRQEQLRWRKCIRCINR
jgi:hypothetical protein